MTLRWHPPAYDGDRVLGMCGEISVGAVFPPISGGRYWRWRCWIGTTTNPAEGSASSEALARAEVAVRFQRFLDRARLEARP